MKTAFAAAAAIMLFAGAGPASAQMMPPMSPAPMQQPAAAFATPSWMQDDGSSSDHPIHNPGDFSADGLNAQYQGGLPVAPPNGLPAPYIVR